MLCYIETFPLPSSELSRDKTIRRIEINSDTCHYEEPAKESKNILYDQLISSNPPPPAAQSFTISSMMQYTQWQNRKLFYRHKKGTEGHGPPRESKTGEIRPYSLTTNAHFVLLHSRTLSWQKDFDCVFTVQNQTAMAWIFLGIMVTHGGD